jgi:signal transduction histidine kinase
VNFRLKIAAWFSLSLLILAGALVATAHWHLDEELRKDRWDRSHPKFPQWVIHGSYTDEEVRDILGELVQVWLWVGIPLALASLGVGYFIARRSARPIRTLNRELAALETRALGRGVTLPENDPELALLVRHINDLLSRAARSYDEMAEFSAKVAHELRTPLTLLRMRVEAASPELPPEFSEELQEEIRRLSQLVERSLLAAKAEGGKLEPRADVIDLSALLDDLREGYAVLATERAMTWDWQVPAGVACVSDPDLLRQILHNILSNAIRHGSGKACLVTRAARRGRVLVELANFVDARNSAAAGAGMGLRLVRSLAGALPGTRFHARRAGRLFVARLLLPVS